VTAGSVSVPIRLVTLGRSGPPKRQYLNRGAYRGFGRIFRSLHDRGALFKLVGTFAQHRDPGRILDFAREYPACAGLLAQLER
jgi:hypothetical protein